MSPTERLRSAGVDGSVATAAAAMVLLVCGMQLATPVAAVSDHYCGTHHFADSEQSGSMQFTKEVVSREYATLPEYKSLHCCAKGYQSIEWFMNGKPLSHDASTLIINPATENQTIFTYSVAYSDAGNYTCVLRNATHKREHRIELHIQPDAPDTPLATFRPHDISVGLHHPSRLFCEAYVGHVKLPDAHSVVTWSHVFNGVQTPLGDGAHQVNVNRDANQIVGAYLHIPHMKPANYGRYVCRIDIGNAANRLELFALIDGPPTAATNLYWSMTVLQLALGAALLTLGLLVLTRYSLAWYRLWRKREGHQCRRQGAAAVAAAGGAAIVGGGSGGGGSGGGGGRRSGGGGANGMLLDGGSNGSGSSECGCRGGNGNCNSIPNQEKAMHFRNVV